VGRRGVEPILLTPEQQLLDQRLRDQRLQTETTMDELHPYDDQYDDLPDVRDGLNRKERIVLHCLNELQAQRQGRSVPTVMLYGRVVEHVNMSVDELQSILQRFVGVHGGG